MDLKVTKLKITVSGKKEKIQMPTKHPKTYKLTVHGSGIALLGGSYLDC